MRAFSEIIEGKSYSIEEVKQLFIDYTLRHKGNVNEKIRNIRVETIKEVYHMETEHKQIRTSNKI